MPPFMDGKHYQKKSHHGWKHFDFSKMTPEEASLKIRMCVAKCLMFMGVFGIIFQVCCCGFCLGGMHKFKNIQKENESFQIHDPRRSASSAVSFPVVTTYLMQTNQLTMQHNPVMQTSVSYDTQDIPRGTAINS